MSKTFPARSRSFALLLAVTASYGGLGPGASEAAPRAGSGRLVSVGPMRVPRSLHTATLLPDGRVLVAGGMRRDGVWLASAEIYDPLLRTFEPTPGMALERGGHTATLLLDGRVLVAGGWTFAGTTASAEIFDPATGRFTPTGAMRVGRGNPTATRLADGRVLVAGGASRVEVFTPATGRFAVVGGATGSSRYFATATRLANGAVLILGGYDDGADGHGPASTASAMLYRPRTRAPVAS